MNSTCAAEWCVAVGKPVGVGSGGGVGVPRTYCGDLLWATYCAVWPASGIVCDPQRRVAEWGHGPEQAG